MGVWAGDKIVIAGDYDISDTNGIKTSSNGDTNRNLYDMAEEEYENITGQIIKWLANDAETAEMLAKRAERDSVLLNKLSDLVFIHRHKQIKESLDKVIGKEWTKMLKK